MPELPVVILTPGGTILPDCDCAFVPKTLRPNNKGSSFGYLDLGHVSDFLVQFTMF